MSLTPKQEKFCDEYLIDLNATQAAIRAGYSARTAEQQASRLLSNVKVKAEVSARMQAREKRTEITQDRVLQEYAKIAFLDPRRLYDANGNLLAVHELDADVAAAISGVDVHEERSNKDGTESTFGMTKKIKLVDKKGALDSVARHLGMFTDRIEHTGPEGGPVKVEMNPTERARRIAFALAKGLKAKQQ